MTCAITWLKTGPGPKLIDKLHVYVGDGDNFYLNLAVYQFQDFLKHNENPHYESTFGCGRPKKGHGWQPVPTSNLLQMMAQHHRKCSQRHGYKDVEVSLNKLKDYGLSATCKRERQYRSFGCSPRYAAGYRFYTAAL